jgi:Tfp pilus assembly protein PilW
MQKSRANINGVTLVETLLYVAIFGVMIVAFTTFSKSLVSNRMQSQSLFEVNDQGEAVLKTITQTLRNADQVNSPSAGNTTDSLSVDTASSGTSPTIFSVVDGVLNIKEGGGEVIPLTNSKVVVSDLVITNLSRPDTVNAVKVSFKLTSATNSNYFVTFQGSGGPRK